jgi:hypothetical protein
MRTVYKFGDTIAEFRKDPIPRSGGKRNTFRRWARWDERKSRAQQREYERFCTERALAKFLKAVKESYGFFAGVR